MTKNIVGLVWALALGLLPQVARAEIETEEVSYKQGDTSLRGFLAWDTSVTGKRPAVLLVHEWWGQNQHVRNQAVRLAKAGYIGFAIDMYGDGKVAKHPADAKTFMAEATSNFAVEKARFDAGLAWLKQRPQVDTKKIAAVGYCFGGGVVLDMLRTGEEFPLVATFHGALATKQVIKPGNRSHVLILHGAADPMVPPEQVAAFKQEFDAAHVTYRIVEYPGVQHSFTNPDADKSGVPGLVYNAQAAEASFKELLKALKQTIGTAQTAKLDTLKKPLPTP